MQGESREYLPAEDTFLLDDHIRGASGGAALDIGTGSGYLARTLEKSFDVVVGTDIDRRVLAGRTYPAGHAVCCDGADALRMQFDLIVCNLPYLATDSIEDPSTDGGRGGTEVPLRIIRSAIPRIRRGGRFLFVTSSLSDYRTLMDAARACGLDARILARKRLFFEELILVEARRLSA